VGCLTRSAGRACNAGYQREGAACKACAWGTQYRLLQASLREGGVQTVCQPCATCTDTKTYESSACLPWQNRACATCLATCGEGRFVARGCNLTANTQCVACRPQCDAGSYRSTPQKCVGTDTYDVVLASCRSCLAVENCTVGETYLSGICTGAESSSNACAGCTQPPPCPPGYYNGGCGGYADTHCMPYRTCAAGEYLNGQGATVDGTCLKCRDCTAEGKQTMVGCSRYANTACGGELCGEATPCGGSTSHVKNFCDYLGLPSRPTCGVCPVSQLLCALVSAISACGLTAAA
jgi:hypothetical protein